MKRILSFLLMASLLAGVSFAQEAENAANEEAPVAAEMAPAKAESETSKKFKARASVEGDAWFALTFDGNTTNAGGKNALNNVSLNAKSRLKINMDLLPKFTSYLEVLILNNEKKRGNIWTNSNSGNYTGFRDFFIYGLLAKPIDHWGQEPSDNEFIMLDQAKIGIDTEWFDWETGLLNAKMPERKIAEWDTVKGIKANAFKKSGGYGWFGMEKNAKKNGLKGVGAVGLNAGASFSHNSKGISNFELNAASGSDKRDGLGNLLDMFAFFDIGFMEDLGAEKASERYAHTVGLQYDGAISYEEFGKNKETQLVSSDILLGYSGKLPADFTLNVNALFNIHHDGIYANGGSNEKRPVKDLGSLHSMALSTKLGWKYKFIDKLELGFKMRGNNTNLLFVEKPNDVLGDKNSLAVSLADDFVVYSGIKLGVDTDVQFTLDKDATKKGAKAGAGTHKDNVQYGIKPHADFDLNELANMNGGISFYTQLKGVTEKTDEFKRGSGSYAFICEDVGVKFGYGSEKKPLADTINFYNLYVNWHNGGDDAPSFSFLTVSGDIKIKKALTINGGIGARIPQKDVKHDSDTASPVGVFLGASYKLSDKTIGGPLVFVRTQVGMKGYKGLGDDIKVNRNKDTYVIDSKDNKTDWDVSAGIKWTF